MVKYHVKHCEKENVSKRVDSMSVGTPYGKLVVKPPLVHDAVLPSTVVLSNINAQTLLTSIIKPLTAYLALESLYRTTTWAICVRFGFMNWDSHRPDNGRSLGNAGRIRVLEC